MILLILGLLLWVDGHLWYRVFPAFYARLGKAGYAASAVTIVVALVLMVIGYRSAEFIPVWSPPGFLTPVNNILMILAIYTYFATAVQRGVVPIVGRLKHPQLTGFKIWTVAHLLVNGDLASIVLFGGLLAWAVAQVIIIKRKGEKHDASKAPIKSAWVHLAIVAVVFILIAAVHGMVGPSPFGG